MNTAEILMKAVRDIAGKDCRIELTPGGREVTLSFSVDLEEAKAAGFFDDSAMASLGVTLYPADRSDRLTYPA